MDITEMAHRLAQVEEHFGSASVVLLDEFETSHGKLRVYLTDRLRRNCQKGRVWATHEMIATLKNVSYGFDRNAPRSRGGVDGIFRVDRRFKPANSMMKKLFARFIDKPDPLIPQLVQLFGTSPDTWTAVRVVSHHMRLLGVFDNGNLGVGCLVLVDYDDEKDR